MCNELEEEWRDIKDFPNYQISNYGKIYSKKSKILLHPDKHPNGGHLRVTLFKNKKRYRMWVHVLVLETFCENRPSDKHVCRHLDGNPENNYIGNLSWGTQMENILDRGNNPNDSGIKLTENTIVEIKNLLILGKRPIDISKELNISESIISNIKSGKNWSDVGVNLSNYHIKRRRQNLSTETVRKIKKFIRDGLTNKEIAEKFGITKNCVSCIRCGFRYKNIN